MTKLCFSSALLLTSFLVPMSAVAAPPVGGYPVIYAFGDSISDDGNDYARSKQTQPVSPPYWQGRYTNGPVWVDDMAAALSLIDPSPGLLGGNDYANGGAYTGVTPLHTLSGGVDLPGQLTQFKKNVPKPNKNALYLLDIGADDVRLVVADYNHNPPAVLADIQDAVNNEVTFVQNLAIRGAQHIAILNVPNIGSAPSYSGSNSGVATMLSSTYNQELVQGLQPVIAQYGLNVEIVDIFTLNNTIIANPSAYGFTNVTTPVWTGSFNNPTSGTLNATGAAQNLYLFFDGEHCTAPGHQDIANLALSNLP